MRPILALPLVVLLAFSLPAPAAAAAETAAPPATAEAAAPLFALIRSVLDEATQQKMVEKAKSD